MKPGSEKLNILWVCQYYLPDRAAPSMRGSELKMFWEKQGARVEVLTAFPHHPHGIVPPKYVGAFHIENEIKRVYVFTKPNPGFIVRLLGQLSFGLSCLLFFPFLNLKKPDVVIASSPSPFCVLSARIIAWVYGAKLVMEVRDLWPEVFLDLGLLKKGPIYFVLNLFSSLLYRLSDSIVCVTKGFVKELEQKRPYTKEKLAFFPNGANIERFDKAMATTRLGDEVEAKLQNKKILSYIGTLGISHGLSDILKLAKFFEQDSSFIFLFIGDGHDKHLIETCALKNVVYHPSITPDEVISVYKRSYMGFVSLKAIESFKNFIPSKMFELMSAQKPIIGLVKGESRNILEEANCALSKDPSLSDQDCRDLYQQISGLSVEKYQELATDGRKYVEEYFNRETIAQNYLNYIRDRS